MPISDYAIRVPENRLKLRDLRRKGLVEEAVKLGEHLKNRRLILGLTQQQAADRLRLLREVYDRWERNERAPVVSAWPSIIAFLGYYPGDPDPDTVGLVLMARRVTGLDQKALAGRLGVIHQKLRRWEHGSELPDAVSVHLLVEMAGSTCATRTLLARSATAPRPAPRRSPKRPVA